MNDFVCMYIHVHLFLCICACMFVYGYICLCVAMDEDACMYVQCIYKCTDVCTVCMKTYVYASLHLGVHVCMCLSVSTCFNVCVSVLFAWVCMYVCARL